MDFTSEQKSVINARRSNLLVSAAAGSGKTAVLVERIIQLISQKGPDGGEPVDIDRLLVVTFTRAAASQMKERIHKAIERKLEEEPGNMHLQRQETLIHNARIMTIDAFCQLVIRENFGEIGIDPSYRVADEGEIRLLAKNAMADFLEEKYAEEDKDLLLAADFFSKGSSDTELEENINKLYKFSQGMPFPGDYLKEQATLKRIDEDNIDNTYWIALIRENCQKILSYCAQLAETAYEISQKSAGPYMYMDLLEKEKDELWQAVEAASYDDMRRAVVGFDFGKLSTKQDPSVSVYFRDRAKAIRDEYKKRVRKLEKDFFTMSKEDMIASMRLCDEALGSLCRLTAGYTTALEKAKNQRGVIDFNDMEHMALNILLDKDPESGDIRASDVAHKYRGYYREILIDEYQDSNMVQELILSSVSGEEDGVYNRFMVGDVKQSIYKFRLAKPEIFMKGLREYSREEAADFRRIDLHKNFRSRCQVLDFVNYIFRRIMAVDLGSVDYDEDAMLQAGADYPLPDAKKPGSQAEDDPFATELLLIKSGAEDDSDNDTGAESSDEEDGEDARTDYPREYEEAPLSFSNLNSKQQEAYLISGRIKQLMEDGLVSDNNGGFRKVRYSDIVILLRTGAVWADSFRKVLEARGIPAYVESRTGYFDAVEVAALMDLLKILDNPLLDISLAGVMHSMLFSFTDSELASLRALYNHVYGPEKKMPLYEELKLVERGYDEGAYKDAGFIKNDELDALLEKLKSFMRDIDDLREHAVYMPVHELLGYALDKTSYLELISAMPSGSRRRANVDMLMERASSFEKTSFKGLFHFVRYIEELRKYEVDYGEANVLDENADLVRIMSIHKSKGLEFPIVFVAGMSKTFNTSDSRDFVLMDEKLGIAGKCTDSRRKLVYSTPYRNLVSGEMRLEALGEELRVLYVAMTRAKEKLILLGSISKLESKLADAVSMCERKHANAQEDETVPYGVRSQARSYMDLLIPALSYHPAIGKLAEDMGLDFDKSAYSAANNAPNYGRDSMGNILPMEELLGVVAPLKISVYSSKDLRKIENQEEAEAAIRKLRLDKAGKGSSYDKVLLKKLDENFSWKYSHTDYQGLFTKTTVTELKKAAHAGEEEEAQMLYPSAPDQAEPLFIRGERALGAAARGSIYHRVMELLDHEIFDDPIIMSSDNLRSAYDSVMNWMRQKEDQGLLSEGSCDNTRPYDIISFLRSDLGKRMAASYREGGLYREHPFMLGLPARSLGEQFPESELVLIQGVIDAYFMEEGEIVLLDYKTDKVSSDEELSGRYKVQLDYYQTALERLLHKKVKSRYLYSFCLGHEVKV
ncbi:UvrD-helicase domain-containing protein [Butyrivibrio sp. MC2013]|uniref:UvrD-helicase domain-containing protein n=1 Tax=Butyrivibrio sp. MC2013 TaxID=1280686 RepID=UPI000427543D|nr:UvrD-helicase domain-containing protein [Butyrivibrio sp. MC2013]